MRADDPSITKPSHWPPRLLTAAPIILLQLEDTFTPPGYLSTVFIYFGAILIILGASAWVVNAPGSWGRGYGRWLFFCGVIILIVGYDFSGIVAFVRSLMRGG